MTTSAQSIIRFAQETLQDVEGTRWPATELVRHLNDGQREIATLRPELGVKTAAVALVAGAKQSFPADCAKPIEVTRNTGGAAMSQVDRKMLDALGPTWYSWTGTTKLQHFTHDPREPRTFYVYPPAALGASVDVVYTALPVDVAAPGGATYGTVTGNISTPDVTKNALQHFCIARAYMKDAEFGGNSALASAHMGLFKTALGEDAATDQAVQPNV